MARRAGLWLAFFGVVTAVPLGAGASPGLSDGDLGAALAGGALGACLSAVFTAPLLPLAVPQGRGRAVLVVESAGLTFRHPGMLRRPIQIKRDDVHSVYVGPLDDVPGRRRRLEQSSTLRQRLRQIDQEAFGEIGVPGPDSVLLPDLSLQTGRPNLLVVFRIPLPLGRDVRRGMGLANLALRASGPTRITYARGVIAEVEDETTARRALLGWPTTDPVPADVGAWLRGHNRQQAAEAQDDRS